jgi:hypothetical protein
VFSRGISARFFNAMLDDELMHFGHVGTLHRAEVSRNVGVYGPKLLVQLFDSKLLVCAHRIHGKKASRAPRLQYGSAHRLQAPPPLSVDNCFPSSHPAGLATRAIAGTIIALIGRLSRKPAGLPP